jgi:hypothetical protein
MRKLFMSLSVLIGLMFAGTIPASANPATGLTAVQIDKRPGLVTEARHRWRRHHHWGGPGIYFGFGWPYYWGYYPRYRYYYYDDYYYRPYYYYGPRWRHRHWRHHHWRHHRHHRRW